MTSRELALLFDRYCDGTLTPLQAEQLLQHLQQDPTALSWFVEAMKLANLLTHTESAQDEREGFVRAFYDRLDAERTMGRFLQDFEARRQASENIMEEKTWQEALGADEATLLQQAADQDRQRIEAIERLTQAALKRFKAEEQRKEQERAYREYKSRQRRLLMGVGSLAALVLLFMVLWLSQFEQKPAQPPIKVATSPPATLTASPSIIASITQAVSAQWGLTDQQPLVGTELPAIPFTLHRGFVELTFADGAQVILEAPADVQLRHSDRMSLKQGKLVATVPPQAFGFQVDTPHASIVDLGTEFGVLASTQGPSEVHVFQGKVNLRESGANNATAASQIVTANQARRIPADGSAVTTTALAAQRFRRSWHEALYVPYTGGALQYCETLPPSLEVDAFQDPEHIQLLLEQTQITLREDIKPVSVASGYIKIPTGDATQLAEIIHAGTQVDSYLLHLDIPKSAKPKKALAEFTGSVTFSRPILALLVSAKELIETDALLGNRSVRYGSAGHRGVAEVKSGYDSQIVIRNEGHTLDVVLRLSNIDQIRVLVAAVSNH